jgi:hypothetical protein
MIATSQSDCIVLRNQRAYEVLNLDITNE